MTAPALHLVEDADDLFDARPVLRHIRDFARARMCGPWAVLSVILVRAACAVEPDVQLPPLIGGRQSLNLFAALVGPSGGGKGAAEACAADAIRFTTYSGAEIETDAHPLGSGEGISRVYRPHGTNEDETNPVTRAIFTAPEIDSIAALGSRQGSTLMPELRKVYSGEGLGFSNASKMSAPKVSAHSYRAGLVVGVQPLRARALLGDADGGTPQRFIWADVKDPEAPDEPPECPKPRTVRMCKWEYDTAILKVPDNARRAIRAHRLAILRGYDVDPLDGHALLCRLKVAAALMILDGESVMDEDDWQLAGEIMRHSAGVRDAVAHAMNEQRRTLTRAKGLEDGERQSVAADVMDRKASQRARQGILRRLANGHTVTKSELRRSLAKSIRDSFDSEIIDLLNENIVTEIQGDRGVSYRITGV
jgi:hypothetical protein